VGFQFKVKLAAVMAEINGFAAGLSYIASQGNFNNNRLHSHINWNNTRNLLL